MSETELKRTALFEQHVVLGAKIVPFAGYEMPVQYPMGILNEHKWCREHAGLFDVSHMGQCSVIGRDFENTARFLETLVPADVLGLKPGQQRYSQFLTSDGGVIDDLMIVRPDGDQPGIDLIVNAGRKDVDYALISKHLPQDMEFMVLPGLSLLALQGPEADAVMTKLVPAVAGLPFMFMLEAKIAGVGGVHITRSGYTGEDGFEISVANENAAALWKLLLADDRVKPIGLGARDSLRLEAGLCLYGHELDETISPIEAQLQWSIAKRRREQGGFAGAARVQRELKEGPSRKRVGIKPDGRAPAREGTEIQDLSGRKIGVITSGGFGPTVNGPVTMGYVETACAVAGTKVQLMVRGNALPASVVALPFVPNRFKR